MRCSLPLLRAWAAAVSLVLIGLALGSTAAVQAQELKPLYKDLVNPESVAISPDLKIFVSVIGEFDKDGDGQILMFDGAKRTVVADGLNDPKGIVFSGGALYITDKNRVLKLDGQRQISVVAAPEAFPAKPLFLNDIEGDTQGNLYVSDSGDLKGGAGAVYKIDKDGKISTVVNHTNPLVKTPNGLLMDGPEHLLLVDFNSGDLFRIRLADSSLEKIGEGFPGGDGLAWDFDRNLYVTQWTTGRVSVLRGGRGPAETIGQFKASADCCVHPKNGLLYVPDMTAGTLTTIPWVSNNPTDVDTSILAVKIVPAFEELQFDRPIVLTHAGDGSQRLFVAQQKGKIFVFPNDESVSEPTLYLDVTKKVQYKDNENEEGLLGFAFHPQYKKNGQFFLYYTTTDAPHTSVISRFTVSKENPNQADPASEQEILRIPQPFWNHNGGTIAFGPDGFLYVGLGDGGSGADPLGNGQNLGTLLGSILRLDIDRKDEKLGYAIPKDNPFIGHFGARPEIWAYGLRNIWRMSFDRTTGSLWAADVGQDIWEEINVVTRGGNYGWNQREGMHRFRATGSPPRNDLIDPIWEYHHDIGRSITGGHVYRGKRVAPLQGHYLYADYVTGRVWALNYDPASKRVTANRPILGNTAPVMSFGEDEAGEVYFMTTSGRLSKFVAGE